MRILMAGSSGFLGSRLIARLRSAGHEVVQLVRREPGHGNQARWDPDAGTVDRALVSTVDAVVNLGGASIAGRRWTARYKQTLLDSRVRPTATLAAAVAAAEPRPRVMLNASGVGFYGDTGDREVDEQSAPGRGFLADLSRQWEAATDPAQRAGVRVVQLRTGLPLDRHGGMLKPLLLPFRLGVGGRLASGRQYVPWVSLVDWLGAVEFLLAREDLSGPVNLTGPTPTTNAEFVSALAKQLHRPALLPLPGFALRAILGEIASEAIVPSARVLPGRLVASGFAFQHRTVRDALAAAFA
jgi:uncharacterized protein